MTPFRRYWLRFLAFLFRAPSLLLERPKMPEPTPKPRHEGRYDRQVQRWMWQASKWDWYTKHHKAPLLRGARLARVQDQCSPKHLTVLCRGARLTWGIS